jgi:MFS family permease
MLLSSLGTSVANVALPTLAQTFGASFQAVQWVVLAYLLAVTTAIVGAGRLGDLVGRRRLLLTGIAVFTSASMLCGLAPSLGALIAARAAQGLGAAVMMALAMAFVSETVPQARVGSAMGVLGAMSAVGTALGPSAGGVLLAGPGWRTMFLATVPMGLVALLLAYRHLPADRSERPVDGSSFDAAGTLLLAATLGAYALAVTVGRGRFGALNLALLTAAVLGLALFTHVEARTPSPLIRLSMLRDQGLGSSLASNALVSTVMMGTLVVGPFHLARALGLGPALVGLVMAVGPLVSAATAVPAGRLADRAGTRRATLIGLGAMMVGAASLAALPTTLGLVGYVGPMMVVTAGYTLFQTANNTAVMADVRANERGVVAGLLSLSRNLGLVSGASVMGAVFALAAGAVDVASAPPDAVAAGTRITFATAAALMIAALALAAGPRRFAALSSHLPLRRPAHGTPPQLLQVRPRRHEGHGRSGAADLPLEPRATARRAGATARLPDQRLRVLHRHARRRRAQRGRERAAPRHGGRVAGETVLQ